MVKSVLIKSIEGRWVQIPATEPSFPNTAADKVQTTASIASDLFSWARKALWKSTRALKSVSVLNGIAGSAAGVGAACSGVREACQAAREGDYENLSIHSGMAAYGFFGLISGTGMTISQLASPASQAAVAGGLLYITTGFLQMLCLGGVSWYRHSTQTNFREELDTVLCSAEDGEQALKNALFWMIEKVSLSEAEYEEIQEKNENDEEAIQKAVDRSLSAKWSQFKQRTSKAACEKLQETIEDLESGSLDNKKLIALIDEVDRANSQEIFKHKILLAIALVTFAVFLALPPLWILAIGTVSCLLWLIVDAELKTGEKFWEGDSVKKVFLEWVLGPRAAKRFLSETDTSERRWRRVARAKGAPVAQIVDAVVKKAKEELHSGGEATLSNQQ